MLTYAIHLLVKVGGNKPSNLTVERRRPVARLKHLKIVLLSMKAIVVNQKQSHILKWLAISIIYRQESMKESKLLPSNTFFLTK